MQKYSFIFIVLIYKNHRDLQSFFRSVKQQYFSYKIVLVNAYYDTASMETIKQIAQKNNCDFINIENKGYSFGNNKGIEYSCSHYEFDYLIVSNPDVVIKKNCFDYQKFVNKKVVIAPKIVTKTGKKQNPYWVIDNKFAEYLIYRGYKTEQKKLIYTGIATNKIIRILFIAYTNLIHRNVYKVYASHGSFVIFTKAALLNLSKVYDEAMFLFAEEALLAHNLKKKKIPTLYTNKIKIFHKEDGSMSISKINEIDEEAKSIVYYYKKYIRKDR